MKRYITYLLLLALLTTPIFTQDLNVGNGEENQDIIDIDNGEESLADDSEVKRLPEDYEPELMEVDEIGFGDNTEGRTLASSYPNIKIAAYYGALSSAPSNYKKYMETSLVPAIIDYYQAALKIKYPISGGKLLLSSYSKVCGITLPSDLRKSGVPADLLILFDSELDNGSSWVAESYNCILSVQSKRTLIGKTVVNRALYKDPGSDVLLHEKNIYMMIHEVAHVLGFAGPMFKYFITETGKTRTGHILTKTLDGASAKVIDVPPLTDRLRRFFGCSSLAGAYMEGSGSSATAGSHFEKRMFPFETMSTGLIHQMAVSEFTLAMLEGSGWYVPDYSMADPYWFGQGQGCNFLMQSCTNSNFKFDEFCTGKPRGCTVPGRGGGSCAAHIRSNNCRFQFPNVNYDCENPDATRYARYPSIESYGRSENSKCFTGTLSPTSTTATTTSYCFKYECLGEGLNTQLRVIFGGKFWTCKFKGPYRPSGYNGHFDCPDPLTFCSTVGAKTCPRGCMGRGTCVDGVCQCKKGFSGKDCAANV